MQKGSGGMWSRSKSGLVGLCLLCMAPAVATAQQTGGGEWTYTISPYFWGAGQSGKVSTFGNLPPASIDLSFSDILEDLDFGAMIVGNANNGRFGISADLVYVKTSEGGDTPGDLFSDVNLKTKTGFFSVTGEYLVAQTPDAQLWAAGGVRYWDVSTDLSLGSGSLPGRSLESGDSWFDPMVGLRGRADLNDKVFVTGWAYLGGFDVGSDSMSDLFAGVGYRFGTKTSGVLGYRYMSVDREDGDFLYDVEQQGLVGGVSFAF
jgi:hypothetical protein